MSSVFGGQVQPQQAKSLLTPTLQDTFLSSIFQAGGFIPPRATVPNTGTYGGVPPWISGNWNPQPGTGFQQNPVPGLPGMPAYPGPTAPDVNQTMLAPFFANNQGGWPMAQVQNIAKFGTTGGTNYLAPFLTARPYSSGIPAQ